MASESARIAVIVPCYDDGAHVEETVASIREDEPFEMVVVDDASTDPHTIEVLERIEASGTRVLRHEENRGVGAARNTGLAATTAPLVFPLDSDDVACEGVIGRLADLLDADPAVAVAYGDYEEFGEVELVRAVPDHLDPFRVSYTNEYPPAALFRRSVLDELGGWDEFRVNRTNYEDWDLWMKLAEDGRRTAYLGHGIATYRQRVHGPRLLEAAKRNHSAIYRRLRSRHRGLFARKAEHRRASSLGSTRKVVYPILYGRRPRFGFEPKVKAALDKLGLWTLQR